MNDRHFFGNSTPILCRTRGMDAVVLRVPSLDRAFSTTEPSGEALLAAPAGWVPSGAAPPVEGGSFN
ncbi:MAG: hypothetical protein Ct9H300mP12_02300 [Acidimicrobiales bacterium]|nr:MAG: hypothetical protein Ct9H300mP12_02300 [Acidimicrobiales bacterium]